MDRILILDFGSQTTQLIGRRIREIGVYSEIVPGDSRLTPEQLHDVKGIILSGSPCSVYEEGAPHPDPQVYDAELPLLGICYGFHQEIHHFGGEVKSHPTREFGRSPMKLLDASPLFEGIPDGFLSWMSHGDSVAGLPEGFVILAKSERFISAACHPAKRMYGIQFHPEVSHCEYGTKLLENFVATICGAHADWSMEQYVEMVCGEILEQANDREVLLLISGGVDSTVVAALLLRALDPSRVHLMYIDTGLMRKNETPEISANLRELGARNLHIVDASEDFLGALAGIIDPEEKRKRIGDLFIRTQEREIGAIGVQDAMLAQGTLYTDMIESGGGVGRHARVIKSHHNVRTPLVAAKRKAGLLIEPLRLLYKDEVRELGRLLGVSESVVGRHPFPGPGLAVRIIGEVTRERCDILREADFILIDELKRRSIYDEIWQAFCVLLPVRSVGVTGDSRNYGFVAAVRAITSRDGMTADVYPFEMKDLLEISARITNSVKAVGRVVYDVSSKPPATIEWE